jgi:putative ubiquitin-RnfH superfamily antitoxin RatB of RatAB toxin-antitoxin module
MNVTVVYALPGRQLKFELEMAEGATVADAIRQSGLEFEFPEISKTEAVTGIHGVVVSRHVSLSDGDRVEIYRPLLIGAKEARRARLKAKARVR